MPARETEPGFGNELQGSRWTGPVEEDLEELDESAVPKAAARRTTPEKAPSCSRLLQPSSKSTPPAAAPIRSSTSGEKTTSKTVTPVVRVGSPWE
jgi:hypothetical protein